VTVEHDAVRAARFANPPSRDEARAALGLSPDAFVVGYIGRLHTLGMPKGLDTLIDAVALASGRGAAIDLLLAGGPDDGVRALRDQWAARGLPAERLHAAGQVPPAAIPRYLAALDVGALPLPGPSTSPITRRDQAVRGPGGGLRRARQRPAERRRGMRERRDRAARPAGDAQAGPCAGSPARRPRPLPASAEGGARHVGRYTWRAARGALPAFVEGSGRCASRCWRPFSPPLRGRGTRSNWALPSALGWKFVALASWRHRRSGAGRGARRAGLPGLVPAGALPATLAAGRAACAARRRCADLVHVLPSHSRRSAVVRGTRPRLSTRTAPWSRRRRLARWPVRSTVALSPARLIAVSDFTAGRVRDALPCADPIVIRNGVDAARFQAPQPTQACRGLLCWRRAGSRRRKWTHLLVEAFAQVAPLCGSRGCVTGRRRRAGVPGARRGVIARHGLGDRVRGGMNLERDLLAGYSTPTVRAAVAQLGANSWASGCGLLRRRAPRSAGDRLRAAPAVVDE